MGIKRILFVAGLAGGYVLGARAGRERYDQISTLAQRAAQSGPAQKAGDLVRHQLDNASDRVAEVTGSFGEKSRGLPGRFVHTAESLRADLRRRYDEFGESFDEAIERSRDAQAQRLLEVAGMHSDAIDELASDDDKMIDEGNADERNLG